MFFDHLPKSTLICAHRGLRSIAPENTKLAMEKAKECGAHCWETDVRISSDQVLILFHDDILERTTDIVTNKKIEDKKDRRAEQFSAKELLQLDAGSWFLEDDPYATVATGEISSEDRSKITGQQIPLLQDILTWSVQHHFPVNLEIKDLNSPTGDVGIIDSIMAMLKKTNSIDLVLLSSFRHEYLFRARALHPTIDLAPLVEDTHPPDLIRYLKSMSATAYHPEESLCDPVLVNDLQKAGFRVNAWTVNDDKRAKTLMEEGVGIITDWPQRLLAAK